LLRTFESVGTQFLTLLIGAPYTSRKPLAHLVLVGAVTFLLPSGMLIGGIAHGFKGASVGGTDLTLSCAAGLA
jgi:hypothetical protein